MIPSEPSMCYGLAELALTLNTYKSKLSMPKSIPDVTSCWDTDDLIRIGVLSTMSR